MILQKIRVGTSFESPWLLPTSNDRVDIGAGYMQGASDLEGLGGQLVWSRSSLGWSAWRGDEGQGGVSLIPSI